MMVVRCLVQKELTPKSLNSYTMSNTDKILLSVLTLVIGGALVLGQIIKKPSVVVLSTTTEAGQEVLGYAEGTHLGIFTADYLEAVTEFKASDLTTSGDARISSLTKIGSIAAFTTTSAATAANVCNSPAWTSTAGAAATTTITLPSTTTLFADCLTTNGDSVSFSIINVSASTSTIIAAGAGGTMLYEASLTIAAAKAAVITIVRDATLTYKALMVSLDN